MHVEEGVRGVETALLETMGVQFAGDTATTPFVTNIDYDEKEQRIQIAYRNGVSTAYAYEPDTLRLSAIATKKAAPAELQDLAYT